MSAEWFGTRLRELREARGWTRKQLADAADMSASGVRDLELGNRKPAWETVLALGKALGVSCETFTQEPTASSEPRPKGRPPKSQAGKTQDSPEEAPPVYQADAGETPAKPEKPTRKTTRRKEG